MKNPGVYLLTLLAFVLINTTACNQAVGTPTQTAMPALAPGSYQRTLVVKGLSRTYLLHVPPGLDNRLPVPVVLAFHGFGGNGLGFQDWTGFNDVADQNGFLVVYPEGEGGDNSWNAGGCCGGAMMRDVDDTAFIRQMLADLGTIVLLDPRRIYATGHSNGAMFVYRLACEMSDTFAAIAPVSGPLFYGPCQPGQPVSVMHVHGLADLVVPYAGSRPTNMPDLVFPPVQQGITAWVQLDGCTGAAQVEKQGMVTHTSYASCRAGSAVELYTIDGLDHMWAQPDVWPTTETIWEFFAAHPKP
jgi:polyhydroxybutyrate depolymerase